MESSRGRRVRLHSSISIHFIDIREPEVLLQRQPKDRDKKAADSNSQHLEKSCKDAQSKNVGITTHFVFIFKMNMDGFTVYSSHSKVVLFCIV